MSTEPDRVGALIIQDGALLLVTGHNEQTYWTPGGRMDDGEDKLQALKRELDEELGVTLESAKLYKTMETSNQFTGKARTTHYYLAMITGEPKPNNEIQGLHWYTKTDFKRQQPRTTKGITNDLVPALIADGLL